MTLAEQFGTHGTEAKLNSMIKAKQVANIKYRGDIDNDIYGIIFTDGSSVWWDGNAWEIA